MPSNINEIAKKLMLDLLISIRKNKDDVFIEDDVLIVKMPEIDDYHKVKKELLHIITQSLYDQNAGRLTVKITNGSVYEILEWSI